ncbi:Aste57867_3914 [Aphanomyces stellatus]|uniref:Aste57867_3914 protein n=1 Tax=Aphanomyces stellatus TaxID=120398 RepID=A0A485KG79_9STRA|nr:hypothetical protein As57867_003903 [Aphanomyces stellatus]VFT81053.1 Aste57867_3914 [Aphanomyces stellatus]
MTFSDRQKEYLQPLCVFRHSHLQRKLQFLHKRQDAPTVTTFLGQLWNTGKASGLGAIVSHFSAGDPLYLFLIDEETGRVVVPSADDTVYPIEFSTCDDHSFLLMNLPFIQSTFKSLKNAAMVGGWLQCLHVLPFSTSTNDKQPEEANDDWITEVERAIIDLSEPAASFEVLQEVLDEPMAFVRGAALRELKIWLKKHDPTNSFAGLKCVISNQWRMVWTADAGILAAEAESESQVQQTLERMREKFKHKEP